jgi:transposase-like protein
MTSYDWPDQLTGDEVFAGVPAMAVEDQAARPASHPGEHSIPRHRWLEVARHIVTGDLTRAQLARQFSISRSGMSQWCKRHRGLIEQVRASADTQYGAVYFADKINRLWALQQEYEVSAGQPDAARPEAIRARAAVLHAIAEELGALPPRTTVMVVPVQHVLEGVDIDLLK